MTAVWMLIWLLTSLSAYYIAKAAIICCSKSTWDNATRDFILICSIILGPIFLLIAAELMLMATIGEGLGSDKTAPPRHS